MYDFLTESLLFDEALILEKYSSIPEQNLLRELQRYREFCLANQPELFAEISQQESNLNVFSGTDRISIDHLKQCALYVHQYIIDDPLIPLTAQNDEFTKALEELRGQKPEPFDREDLAERVSLLKSLTPMVAGNFLKILPISVSFEPPKQLPLLYSESGFSDALPNALMEMFWSRAEVKSVKKTELGYLIMNQLFPCLNIDVSFRGHRNRMGYTLLRIASQQLQEETRTARWAMNIPEMPPPTEEFKAWVTQSVNSTALRIHNQLLSELAMAEQLGAIYSTCSELVCELLNTVLPSPNSIPVTTANVFLNMDLLFLSGIDLNALMRIRTEEGEAFQNFRVALDKQMRELRLEDNPERARIKAENAVHELTEVRLFKSIEFEATPCEERG